MTRAPTLVQVRPLGGLLCPASHVSESAVVRPAVRAPRRSTRPGSLAHRVVSLTLAQPHLTYRQLADATGVRLETVHSTLSRHGLRAAQEAAA